MVHESQYVSTRFPVASSEKVKLPALFQRNRMTSGQRPLIKKRREKKSLEWKLICYILIAEWNHLFYHRFSLDVVGMKWTVIHKGIL